VTPLELTYKMDSEGGIYALIQWGGAEIFDCLGQEAVELARTAEDALERLADMLPELEPEPEL